jgi:iron-sulfur cluster insertion protein
MNYTFSITDNAARRINQIKAKREYAGRNLRIIVESGGCSGYQYKIDFDHLIFKHQDATIIIDDVSITFLNNSTLDFVEDLGSASFEIKNPNVAAKCGCGNSFAI